jgi:actin-like ATPase involved in cell morphogenesis
VIEGSWLVRYALGIDVGTSFTAAAIWRASDQPPKAEVVALSGRMPSVSSVLFLAPDGSVVVGEAAERRALIDPDRVVREFKRRIGDDTPLLVGGRPYAAHDLAAIVVRWVVDRVTEREGGPPDQIAVTHPAAWGPYKKDLLAGALQAVGLDNLTFLAEPEAAAVSYAAQERVEAGTTVAVYDLGGGTFDAAVVRKTGTGAFALLGSAEGLEQLGGADFDESVFAHVQSVVSAQPDAAGTQWDALDIEDPNVLSGLARLRRECVEAKEALSTDIEVSIPVLLPGVSAHVRLVRSEFEEMIRPALEDTVDSLCRAISSADLSAADLGAVLLVGGSSRVPLVSQLVSARLGCPVVVDADPKTTIALGAALSMAPLSQPVPMVTEPGAPPVTDPESPSSQESLPNQAPDRPSIIPTSREVIEDAEDDGSALRRLVAGRLRNVVGVGVLAGVLLISLGVAAAGGGLPGFTDGPAEAVPASANPPGEPVAASGHGGTAKASNAGSSLSAPSRSAFAAAHNTTAPPGATHAINAPAPADSGTQDGRITSPVPPAPSGSTSGPGSWTVPTSDAGGAGANSSGSPTTDAGGAGANSSGTPTTDAGDAGANSSGTPTTDAGDAGANSSGTPSTDAGDAGANSSGTPSTDAGGAGANSSGTPTTATSGVGNTGTVTEPVSEPPAKAPA